MLPIHIALVPSEEGVVCTDELLRVAATLQVQLTRDFEPAWNIPASVSGFTALNQVPPGFLPLIVLPADTLGTGDHAFHTTEKGIPIALVEANSGWSRAASHELLEMVCDPQGKRKVIGDSLADVYPQNVAGGNDQYLSQGQVAYLLEICDPCQDQPYGLNGLEVSDFVLPRYYGPRTPGCGCYSFAGNVERPLELCNGGYVTWYTSFDESPVWQAKKDAAGTLTIGPMTVPAPGSSRSDVDFTNEVFDSLGSSAPPPGPPPAPIPAAELAKRSARRYGAEIGADLKRVLADVSTDPPQVNLDDVLSLLNQLVNTPGYYEQFFSETDATERSAQLRKLGVNIMYPYDQPSKDQLKAVYDKVQHAMGKGTKVSSKLAALMIQGQT